jgi:hypothetical protein
MSSARVDIWDVAAAATQQAKLDCGFARAPDPPRYTFGRVLGKGGFGLVRAVTDSAGNGREMACKTIAKRLEVPNVSHERQRQHLAVIRREARAGFSQSPCKPLLGLAYSRMMPGRTSAHL